jgi:hypothetical protein
MLVMVVVMVMVVMMLINVDVQYILMQAYLLRAKYQ